MKLRDLFKKRDGNATIGLMFNCDDDITISGYTPLHKNAEIVSACRKIAELIGSTTIHLMQNTKDGDVRITNELSRTLDINPMPIMTRQTWIEAIVMNLLLYGNGNAVVYPHTKKGYLTSLEPVAPHRVSFADKTSRSYTIMIDGMPHKPENLLHFVYNPDRFYPYMGQGVSVPLRALANNLEQAQATEKAFLSSKYKPSIIVKVDALTEEFSSPEGRKKLANSYLKTNEGEPWIIPADQFQVEQVKPLTLSDLAIKDTIELDKKTVASLLGVPSFLLGSGEYNQNEWNTFINTKIMAICKGLAQEMTKKLIISPKWYVQFNIWSLLDYDLQKTSSVLLAGSDRGFVSGNEWRDKMNLPPAKGLDEYKVLENYIPVDMSSLQKKLVQNEE